MYESFSKVYDNLVLKENIRKFNNVKSFLEDNNFKGKKMLELACGTGNISLLFAKDGYDVLGTDLSKEMIEKAIEKRNNQEITCEFKIMDMRNIKFMNKFDFVYCLFDGITYMSNLKDIESIFDKTYYMLNEDGYFVFDYFSYDSYKEIYGELTCEQKYIDINNSTIYWTECYEQNMIHTKMNLYEKLSNHRFRVYEETHEQYMFFDDEIKKRLNHRFHVIKEEKEDIRTLIYSKII